MFEQVCNKLGVGFEYVAQYIENSKLSQNISVETGNLDELFSLISEEIDNINSLNIDERTKMTLCLLLGVPLLDWINQVTGETYVPIIEE